MRKLEGYEMLCVIVLGYVYPPKWRDTYNYNSDNDTDDCYQHY